MVFEWLNKTSLFLLTCLLFCSCTRGHYIDTNDGDDAQPDKSIAYLRSLYNNAAVTIQGDFEIRGKVVSTDAYGNFSRSFVVQDESGGIEILADVEEIFQIYPVGSTVVVSCNSLVIGRYGDDLQLGAASGDYRYQVGRLSAEQLAGHIRVDTEAAVAEFRPVLLTVGELSARYLSTWVAFEGMQFIDEELSLAVGNASAGTLAVRHLVDADRDTLDMVVLPGAIFAGVQVPDGNGYIEGVLGAFGGRYRIQVARWDRGVLFYSPRREY